MKYKKFITISYSRYYPNGGLDDICGSADSINEAVKIGEDSIEDTWEIVDRDTWEIVLRKNETSQHKP